MSRSRVVVAGSSYYHYTLAVSVIESFFQRFRVRRGTPTAGYDISPHFGRIINSSYCIGYISFSIGVQKFQCHYFCVPAYTGNVETVIASGSNYARTMCPVAVVVDRVIINVDEVIPVYIVYVLISIVINAVVRNLTAINQDIVMQVSMVVVHTGINNRYDNFRASGVYFPCLRSIYITIRCSRRKVVSTACRIILADVVQRPLQRIKRVISVLTNRNNVIQLSVFYSRVIFVGGQNFFNRFVRCKGKPQFVYSVQSRYGYLFGSAF